MKKMFLIAACLFVYSNAMATHDDPPQTQRNQWSQENCKDAGVTTTVNNDYYTNSYKSQVTVSTPVIDDAGGAYRTRTTVTDYDGNRIDETTHHRTTNTNGVISYNTEYKRDVKATTECKFDE